MINKSILAAAVIASIAFAPFVLAQVMPVPTEKTAGEPAFDAGAQAAPPMINGPQVDPRIIDEHGGSRPGMMGVPQRGSMY